MSKIQRIYYVFKITGHDVKSEWFTNNGLLSWSFVVTRGHSWSLVCTFRQDRMNDVPQYGTFGYDIRLKWKTPFSLNCMAEVEPWLEHRPTFRRLITCGWVKKLSGGKT